MGAGVRHAGEDVAELLGFQAWVVTPPVVEGVVLAGLKGRAGEGEGDRCGVGERGGVWAFGGTSR